MNSKPGTELRSALAQLGGEIRKTRGRRRRRRKRRRSRTRRRRRRRKCDMEERVW